MCIVFFFFSSRRRHTRSKRDWSSDVCSSDLVCLNVTPDHLDRHHTLEKYAAAKGRLFETQRPDDYAVLNADDAHCVAYSAITRGRTVWFSSTRAITPGVWLENESLWFDGELLMPAEEIP